jgi:hypothetical protein
MREGANRYARVYEPVDNDAPNPARTQGQTQARKQAEPPRKGSEVALAVQAYEDLSAEGAGVRVVACLRGRCSGNKTGPTATWCCHRR